MVSIASTICIMFSLIFSIGFPVALLIFIRKKYRTAIWPFFCGCIIWFVFVIILEQILHTVVLSSPIGATIQGNVWIYGLYGGLAAGVFEEVGRLFAMKIMLKKSYSNKYNAVMYGAGHGGFEVIFLLGTGMINNLVYAICINTEKTELLTAALSADQKAQVNEIFSSLIATKPYMFLVGDFERISAVILHIGLSLLVWSAVVYGKKVMFPLAIFIHFLVDAFTVIIAGLSESVFILEAVVLVLALGTIYFAVKIWKNAAQEYEIRTMTSDI